MEEKKKIINLLSSTPKSVDKILDECDVDVRVVKGDGEADVILVDDIDSLGSDVKDKCKIVEISYSDKIIPFQRDNVSIISRNFVDTEIGAEVFKSIITSSSSIHLDKAFGGAISENRVLKITNPLFIGGYSDLIISYALEKELEFVGIRNFLGAISSFFHYLSQKGIAYYPFELEYGVSKDSMLIRFYASGGGVFLEHILASLNRYSNDNPYEGLLGICRDQCHALDIYTLEKSKKIVVTGVWIKGYDKPKSISISNINSFANVKDNPNNFTIPDINFTLQRRSLSKVTLSGGLPDFTEGEFDKVGNVVDIKRLADFLSQAIEEEENIGGEIILQDGTERVSGAIGVDDSKHHVGGKIVLEDGTERVSGKVEGDDSKYHVSGGRVVLKDEIKKFSGTTEDDSIVVLASGIKISKENIAKLLNKFAGQKSVKSLSEADWQVLESVLVSEDKMSELNESVEAIRGAISKDDYIKRFKSTLSNLNTNDIIVIPGVTEIKDDVWRVGRAKLVEKAESFFEDSEINSVDEVDRAFAQIFADEFGLSENRAVDVIKAVGLSIFSELVDQKMSTSSDNDLLQAENKVLRDTISSKKKLIEQLKSELSSPSDVNQVVEVMNTSEGNVTTHDTGTSPESSQQNEESASESPSSDKDLEIENKNISQMNKKINDLNMALRKARIGVEGNIGEEEGNARSKQQEVDKKPPKDLSGEVRAKDRTIENQEREIRTLKRQLDAAKRGGVNGLDGDARKGPEDLKKKISDLSTELYERKQEIKQYGRNIRALEYKLKVVEKRNSELEKGGGKAQEGVKRQLAGKDKQIKVLNEKLVKMMGDLSTKKKEVISLTAAKNNLEVEKEELADRVTELEVKRRKAA